MSVSTEMQITENNEEEKMSAKGRRGKLNIIDSWHTTMFPPLPTGLSSGDYNDDGSDHDNGDDLLLIMMIYIVQCFELSNFGEVSVNSA